MTDSARSGRSLLSRASGLVLDNQGLAATGRLRRPIEKFLLVSQKQSPTFDYYMAPRFVERGAIPSLRVDINSSPSLSLNDETSDGVFVLFCRYVTRDWIDAVERYANHLAGVGLFIDDDIPALIADASVPLTYRTRLILNHGRYRKRLSSLLDFLFVSTPVLAAREATAHPVVVPPVASPDDEPLPRSAAREPWRIAFHSTASHAAEHAWIAPVMRAIAQRVPHAIIDVYESRTTRRFWNDVERVDRHTVEPWNVYRAKTRRSGADILLAPQFANAVNAARAPTKRIDAYRMGAALVTNASGVYAPSDEEIGAGMILPLDRDAWIGGITRLLENPKQISTLVQLNAHCVEAWKAEPIAELYE